MQSLLPLPLKNPHRYYTGRRAKLQVAMQVSKGGAKARPRKNAQK